MYLCAITFRALVDEVMKIMVDTVWHHWIVQMISLC